MQSLVAFLRGIKLGNRRMKMDVLRGLFERQGFDSVESILASGNVVFSTEQPPTSDLEAKIEQHLAEELGYEVDVFLRSRKEILAMLREPPFAEYHHSKTHKVQVVFLKTRLGRPIEESLLRTQTATDELAVEGRDIYWVCRGKLSESELWDSPSVRSLKLPTRTYRTWATIERVARIMEHSA